jgi:hypothetical protein
MKKIGHSDIVGQQGINLIEKITLEMGFVWHPTNLDAGIDGYIEIRNSTTGEVTNCILQVQSKATEQGFDGDTASSFELRCLAKDIDYWMSGNAPVIMVRSRPKTDEAYWVSLKDYFGDAGLRKSGKIVFDKTRDRFDVKAKAALQALAIPRTSGLYLGTMPKQEIIYSNLLKLASFPEHYYVAHTDYRTPAEMFATLRESSSAVRGEWILGGKMLTSFHNLSDRPWTEICDAGTVEELNTDEWAQTDDRDRLNEFVKLLNACLKEKLFPKGVKFSRDNGFYYVRATKDRSDREYTYHSREKQTSRFIFKGYPKKADHTQMSYYRHSAFAGRFVRYGGEWFLQITPNYHFTRDGERPSYYAPALLTGIKMLENNQAVHGQVVMWASFLCERSLFDAPGFIDFTSLVQFELGVGLDDSFWLKREEAEEAKALDAPEPDVRQQSLL